MRRLLTVGVASTGNRGGGSLRQTEDSSHLLGDLILKLRRERRWGPCKMEGYLKNYGGEDVTAVGHNTIHRILIEAGLNNPVEAPRKVWGKRRFQRPYSNNLWQTDYKMTLGDDSTIHLLESCYVNTVNQTRY